MKNDPDNTARPNRWLLLAAATLSGWNVFVLVGLFSLIGIAALLSYLDVAIEGGGVAFYMVLTLTGIISIAAGYKVASMMFKIMKSKTNKYCYISLFFISIITVLLFPRIMQFSIV